MGVSSFVCGGGGTMISVYRYAGVNSPSGTFLLNSILCVRELGLGFS